MALEDIIGTSKLQKLTINSFDDSDRDGKAKNTIEVMFNPESIQRTYSNRYLNTPKSTTDKDDVEYTYSPSSTVRMKLIFDGTNVHKHGGLLGINTLAKDLRSVTERVQEFLNHAMKSKGKIHQPPFLIVKWGSFTFRCRVQSLDVNYTLFAKSGDPLRAELNVSFIEHDALLAQMKGAGKESPDLTHYRIVNDGDQLPLMCHDIYGSSSYYPLVARANKLKDFRNLKAGQEIYFPPIEK